MVNEIVYAAQTNTEMLMLPRNVALVPIGRALLPTSVFDAVCHAAGLNQGMDHFKGRS